MSRRAWDWDWDFCDMPNDPEDVRQSGEDQK